MSQCAAVLQWRLLRRCLHGYAIERGGLPGEAGNRLVKLFELIFLSAVTQTCPISPLVVPDVVGADTMCTPAVQAHSTPGCECGPPVQRLCHTSVRFQGLTTL